MSNYWADRMAQAQTKIAEKTIKETNKQLQKYYMDAAQKCFDSFEATYNKLAATVEAGKEPTPADLYKLDKYWQNQAQIREELMKLGNKEIKLLSESFMRNWFEVYYSIDIPNATTAFNTIDSKAVQQMISQIWCADGKSWSARIWENTELLAEALNEELIHTVTTGKKTTDLKNLLQERFNVSYSRADALVRTEIAHIQTQAAKQRYTDYGIQQVQIWADKDERQCEVCGKLHKTVYPVGAAVPIPAHPRCRCCIIPLVEV